MTGFIDFIRKGNLVALAVAFVIGAAFVALVASFTTNFISPLLGIFGTQSLDAYSFCIGTCSTVTDPTTGAVTYSGAYFGWGAFLTALIGFLITAAVLYFFVVKPYERLEERLRKNKDEDVAPTDVDLLTEIRDALVARNDTSG